MEMWMKIAWAAALGVMLIVLIPRAKHMLKNSRKAEAGEWQTVLLPIGLVVLFVIFLVMMVRG
ncbi:MAG: hypothetical protein AMJ69_00190 [Gammaproteobacteria bacterium SG8_47]|nr:MAG: hypothetical protein AMJ69_00190 [Gammaproteobacteria bacterium SG8_47]